MKQIKNIKLNDSDQTDFVCEACAYGKQCRFPFHKSVRGVLQPGDIVYSVICGPMTHESIQGMRYFILFKDAAIIKNKYMHNYDISDLFSK